MRDNSELNVDLRNQLIVLKLQLTSETVITMGRNAEPLAVSVPRVLDGAPAVLLPVDGVAPHR